jgi:hypothetical protein
MNPPKNAPPSKKKLRTVQSGIGISSLDKSAGSAAAAAEQSFLTSRTARVLLAGAGFLADAVRSHTLHTPHIILCTVYDTLFSVLYAIDTTLYSVIHMLLAAVAGPCCCTLVPNFMRSM